MSFDDHFHPAFHDPWDNRFDVDEHQDENESRVLTSPALSRSPSASIITRYLEEDERQLYNVSVDHLAHPLPGLVRHASFVYDSFKSWRRHTSPASSGDSQDPTDVGCSSGHRRSPHFLSVEAPDLDFPVVEHSGHAFSYALGGSGYHDSHLDNSCVALNEIQKTADQQFEAFAFEETPMYASFSYGVYAQEGYQVEAEEGYQPVKSEGDSTYYSTPSSEHPSTTHARNSSEEPVIRRRRAPSVSVASGRIRKRPAETKRASSHQHIKREQIDGIYCEADLGHRAFPCPLTIYGCTSSFSAKNEWKRHVQTQHLRLGFWRCEQCAQNERGDRKPNDFNRKDLFIQHVRRMHPIAKVSSTKKKSSPQARGDGSDELYLQNEAQRCYRHLRDAPDNSACLFCEQHFSGPGSWEERMEHIGRHMENLKKEHQDPANPETWQEDEEAEMWLLQARIIQYQDDRLVLVDGGSTRSIKST